MLLKYNNYKEILVNFTLILENMKPVQNVKSTAALCQQSTLHEKK